MKIGTKSILANTVAASGLALLLVACGGGDGGDSSTGTLNLDLTDAAVDEAYAVVVEFTGVELQPAEGPRIDYDFGVDADGEPVTRQIDLLALTGGVSESILEGATVPAGDYSWIRLKVNAERGVMDSYIELLDGNMHSLYIPSGTNSGLKLNRGFNVPAGGTASYTIDFDLRKSVHYPGNLDPSNPEDDYFLRPTLRLVDGNTDGALAGIIIDAMNDADCEVGEESIGAVYVFDGNDLSVIDDIDGMDDPVTSANASLSMEGEYAYTVAFLPEGDYVIAFTCDADDDVNDLDADSPSDDDGPVDFVGEVMVTITAGQTTNHDFEIPVP